MKITVTCDWDYDTWWYPIGQFVGLKVDSNAIEEKVRELSKNANVCTVDLDVDIVVNSIDSVKI